MREQGESEHSAQSCPEREKSKYSLTIKGNFMEVFFLPGETVFLTFKLVNGSGWLTSHRLIIVEHVPGRLEEGKRKDHSLKYFENAQIKDTTLTAAANTGNLTTFGCDVTLTGTQ